MLILSRRVGEQVLINNGTIQVKLLEVKGNCARIGFCAPPETDIDREEIYYQKLANLDLSQKAANDEEE
ncbi:carbon storage regulator [Legionella spiritensis]|uniref:Translational regulator CsrA n=1 Tax=Legionella spiritensis TaxID=452 RepID=A0A0W0Z8X8_LEGSP|nr:carbon storage regulator [Legionella spiritensis]KTD65358.1 pleiotropic regulatory protein for carbon source metabolism [Legionella spiritensis]SNV47303.1 protein LvrC [Legionella spiritensis]VEG91202.1 protein LvrC [Legionella spiritensis]VEG91771.1 protein LvrC [Legionella spiritensis]